MNVFSIAVLSAPYMWEEWINLILGIWMIIAPWVLGFAMVTAAATNSVIFGVLIGLDAIWSLIEMQRHGGGHAAA